MSRIESRTQKEGRPIMALKDYTPSFSRRSQPPVVAETEPATQSSGPSSLNERPSTRIEALMTIRAYRDHFTDNPGATIPGSLHRPQMLTEDPDEPLIDRPLGHGLEITTRLGAGQFDPQVTAHVDPYTQKIDQASLQCSSDIGKATYDLSRTRPSDAALLNAVDEKFEREGAGMRAELDDWVSEQRADSPPGTYMIGDLYQVANEAGYDHDEVDMMLYQQEFAVPDHLAQKLVGLGYTNFHGDQTVPAASPGEYESDPESLQPPGTSRSPEVQNLVERIGARLSIDNDRPGFAAAGHGNQPTRDDADADFQR